MVLVFRLSPCVVGGCGTVCLAVEAPGGRLGWESLPLTASTWLLLATSEFGDLCGHVALSQASCFFGDLLLKSLRCVRAYWTPCSPCGDESCHYCVDFFSEFSRLHRCCICRCYCCEDCLLGVRLDPGRRISWVCIGCDDPDQEPPGISFDYVEPLKGWFVAELDERIRLVVFDYEFRFYVRVVLLSGESVRDHTGKVADLLMARWGEGFDRVWDGVYRLTGGRVRQIILGTRFVDETSKRACKWSDFVGRSEARRCQKESPLELPVLLGDWA